MIDKQEYKHFELILQKHVQWNCMDVFMKNGEKEKFCAHIALTLGLVYAHPRVY